MITIDGYLIVKSSVRHTRFRGGDQSPDFIADKRTSDIAFAFEAEHTDTLSIVARHGQRGRIHNSQIVDQSAIVAQRLKALGVLILTRIGGVNAEWTRYP